jgi:hypothetical protein
MRRVARHALVLLALASGWGCASAASQQLTATNRYYYVLAEFERRCGDADTPECRAWYDDLVACADRIEATKEAVRRGGRLPDQLKAMNVACKAALR